MKAVIELDDKMIDTASQIVHNAASLTQYEDTKMNDNQEQNVVEQEEEEQQYRSQIDQEYSESVSEVEAEIRSNLHSLSQDYQLDEVVAGFFFVAQDILDRIGYEVVEK